MIATHNVPGEYELVMFRRIVSGIAVSLTSVFTICGVLYAFVQPYLVTAEEMDTYRVEVSTALTTQNTQINNNTQAVRQTVEAVERLNMSFLEARVDELQEKIEDILVIPEAQRTTYQERSIARYEARIRKLERKMETN